MSRDAEAEPQIVVIGSTLVRFRNSLGDESRDKALKVRLYPSFFNLYRLAARHLILLDTGRKGRKAHASGRPSRHTGSPLAGLLVLLLPELKALGMCDRATPL